MTLRKAASRPRERWALLFALVACLVLFTGALTLAVHDDGFFELEGNALAEAAPGDDWSLIDDGAGDPNDDDSANTAFFKTDDTRIFTGGSTKDDLDVSGWLHTTGSVPDKDELLHGYAARYGDHIYFGADRLAANGDAQMGVWFFQSAVTAEANGTFSGTHTNGDVLVLSDFTKGGTQPTIRVFEWHSPGGEINGTLDLLAGTTDDVRTCGIQLNDPFCAVVNTGNQDSPWSFQPKRGAANVFPAGHFYEGGIDLAFLGLADACFSTVLLETRSSQSVDAVLKDFVSGSFESCGAAITIGSDATNEVGDNHTFTVTVTKTIGGTASPVEGVMPTVTLTPSDGAVVTLVSDECATTGTGSDGKCDVVFTSNSAGVITGHAAASVDINGTIFPVATDGTSPNSGDAVKTFVDAKISVSPLDDDNGITEDHVITATVQKDDGSGNGFSSAPDGTTVTFSLENNTAGAVFKNGISSCTTTGGSCSITITSTAAGGVDVRASTTFSVGGVSLTRTTGSGGNNSADAHKDFIDGTLRWLKHDQAGTLLGGAKFSVCRTHNFNSSTNMMVDITPDICLGTGTPLRIADDETAPGGSGPNADNDPTAGEFQLSQLILGRYVITETDPPAGYAIDPDSQTVDLTLANPSNADGGAGDVVPIFVNEQLFRLIVITCNQSLDELVVSEVTLDGDTLDTIGSVPGSLLGTDPAITESDICAIGGASFGDLAAGTYGPSVEIPKGP